MDFQLNEEQEELRQMARGFLTERSGPEQVRDAMQNSIGYDIEKKRVEEALRNVKKARVEKLVSIQRKDVFSLDLRPASVITLYLLPKLNVKLIPQLDRLKPGSRIVSHDFGMKGVTPDKVVTLRSKEDNIDHTIYLWTTPLKKEKEKEKEKKEEASK